MGLKKVAAVWLVMWGLSYIFYAALVPWLDLVPKILFAGFGIVIVGSAICSGLAGKKWQLSIINVVLALLQIYGGVASWTGLHIWNVPFANKEMFQISMACADLLAAVFLLYLASETWP